MKKRLLLVFLLAGCAKQADLEDLKAELFGIKEVLVETNDFHEQYGVDEKEYEEVIALKSLLEVDRYEMVLVKKASEELTRGLFEKNEVCSVKNEYIYCSNRVFPLVDEIVLRYLNEEK